MIEFRNGGGIVDNLNKFYRLGTYFLVNLKNGEKCFISKHSFNNGGGYPPPLLVRSSCNITKKNLDRALFKLSLVSFLNEDGRLTMFIRQ